MLRDDSGRFVEIIVHRVGFIPLGFGLVILPSTVGERSQIHVAHTAALKREIV
jgi:hypothetical protein